MDANLVGSLLAAGVSAWTWARWRGLTIGEVRLWLARRAVRIADEMIPADADGRLWWTRMLLAGELLGFALRLARPQEGGSR
jgi:hypothetical protein